MEEASAQEVVQENIDFSERVGQLEETVKALTEENERLSRKLEEINSLPVFSVPTTRADGFSAIRDIFRRR